MTCLHRTVLGMVIVLLTSGVAWAGDAYRLALSKREALCNAMLALVNADVKQYRKIRYETHTYFTDIPWVPADQILGTKFTSDYCRKLSVAKFDIDNEGHQDFVLKYGGCLKGKLSDNLYVYGEDDAVSTVQELTDFEDLSRVKIPIEDFNTYPLDEVSETGTQYPKVIAGHLVLQPFAYSRTNYLLMTDDLRYWIVIARLLTRPQLDNVCILQMTEEEGLKPVHPEND